MEADNAVRRDAETGLTALDSFRRLFTILIVVYPIFNRYESVVPFLTVSELLLLLLFAVASIRFKALLLHVDWAAIIFAIYILFDIALHIELYSGSVLPQGAGTAARLALLYLLYALMGRNFIELDYGIRVLTVVSVLVSVYGIVQAAASRAGIALTTYIPGLPIMGNENLDAEVLAKIYYGIRFRMQSVLNEPAALCCYLILPITILLSSEKQGVCGKAIALFLSAVCVMSLSSTGIISVLLLWCIYMIRVLMMRNVDARILTLSVMAGIIGLFFVYNCTDIWSYFMTRTFGNAGISGLSEGTRFYAIDTAFTASDSLFNVLFGVLTAQTGSYLPGFARTYYLYGLCGLVLITLVMLTIARRGGKLSRCIVAIFAFLNIGTEIMLGNFAIYYLCFASGAMIYKSSKGEQQ